MADTNVLKQERAEIVGKLKTYQSAAKLAKRSYTPEEKAEFETGKARVAELDAQIGTAEQEELSNKWIDDAAESLNKTTGRKTEPDSLGGKNYYDEKGRLTGSYEQTDEDFGLRMGDSRNTVATKSYERLNRDNARLLRKLGYQGWDGGGFKSFSDFVKQGLSSHGKESFDSKIHKHYEKLAITGMSETVGSDGGYLVMPEFAPRILDRVYKNDLWSRTDNYTVSGNSMTFVANAETSRATGSRHGGLRGYWLGEGATKTGSKPTFRSITLKLVKLAVVVYLTDELLDDTGNVLSEYVTRKAAEEFNFMIGDALVNGNGVGQPLGLLNWPSLVSVAKESGQLADTLETENIVKMYSRFYGPNRNNMIWLHNQDVEPELFTMTLGVGTGGVVTYMPPGGLSSAPYATLMGRPIFPTEFNPTLGDQGDIIAADLGQMISISKGGIAQASSIHVEFLTDQTALRFVMRLNAGPWESAPLTPYKGSATQSNAVTLDARA